MRLAFTFSCLGATLFGIFVPFLPAQAADTKPPMAARRQERLRVIDSRNET
jgi:hypothetical protein